MKPRRPVAMTMCRMRGMRGGEAWRIWRWVSRIAKGFVPVGEGEEVQRMG